MLPSPQKYGGGTFFQYMLFIGGQTFLGKFSGGVILHGEANDLMMPRGGGSFISVNAISINLNAVNLRYFPQRWDIHLKIILQSYGRIYLLD